MYANADLYGMGKGVFPKDKVVPQPAHPHCLCHYAPVYWGEIDEKKRSNNVEENGRAWLAKQPLHIRQAILGVKDEQEWKAGRVGWMEKARNFEIFSLKELRLTQNGALNDKNDPEGKRRKKHAERYYKEIINNEKKMFVEKISRNTGLSARFVGTVYDHVFVNKHILHDGYRTFDKSYDMA